MKSCTEVREAAVRCMICGTSVEWNRRGRQSSTCGADECRRARRAQSVREHRWRSRGGSTMQMRTCRECETSFEYVRVQGMMGQGPSFCSEECQRKRHLRQARRNTRSCCPGDGSCGECVRGLLCSNCNRGLGMFGDNQAALRAAIDYLGRGPV